MTQVKICGTTSVFDARLAQEAGADFLGVIVNYPRSPRSVSLHCAQEIAESVSIPVVALSVNAAQEELLEVQRVLNPYALQLHGDESTERVLELTQRGLRVWKAITGDYQMLLEAAQNYAEAGVETFVVDARAMARDGGTIYGGTGHQTDWDAARRLRETGLTFFLAGGLTPENVAAAIRDVAPVGVDVVSGVEAQKGRKDPEKVRQFLASVRFQSEYRTKS